MRVADASRQTRLSNDLAAALHDLAVLNHPELGRRIEMRFSAAPMMRR